ncbi:MAG: hypothetical protein LBL98_02855 [Ruminococcus sp.]|jgi:hypothetical protein|nr:hypothetical protein [Ruminococcus sp.]
MKTRNDFDVPVFEYYDNGGKYSGCRRGTKKDDFNYKTEVVKADDKKLIAADIWYGIMNFESSEKVSGEMFSFDSEGLRKAYEYIDEAYELWLTAHEPITHEIAEDETIE